MNFTITLDNFKENEVVQIKREYDFYINDDLKIRLTGFTEFRKEPPQRKFRKTRFWNAFSQNVSNTTKQAIIEELKFKNQHQELRETVYDEMVSMLKLEL